MFLCVIAARGLPNRSGAPRRETGLAGQNRCFVQLACLILDTGSSHYSSILGPLLESKVLCATGEGKEGEYDYTCGQNEVEMDSIALGKHPGNVLRRLALHRLS